MEHGLYKNTLIIIIMNLFLGSSNRIWFEENANDL